MGSACSAQGGAGGARVHPHPPPPPPGARRAAMPRGAAAAAGFGAAQGGAAHKGVQVDGRELLPGGCGGGGGGGRPARWRKGDAVGAGSFGAVYLGLNTETGELMAIKEVTLAVEGAHLKEAAEQLEQELVLLAGLDHPNIVRYLGTSRDEGSLLIFLEYVPGGNIASLVARFGPLGEAVIRIYTRQLLEGQRVAWRLAYLHAQRVVHRDVKGANLLLEKDGRIKLADFGMAKQMVEAASFTKSFKGSAFWMAPEVIRQQGHGVAADVWSVGCTVLEMATGKPPWAQCSSQVQAIFKIASSQELPAVPETLSPEASEFVLLCLQRDPGARPSAEELLRHPFVAAQPGSFIPALRSVTAMDGLGPLATLDRGHAGGGPFGGSGGSGLGGTLGRRPRLLFGGGRGAAAGGAGGRQQQGGGGWRQGDAGRHRGGGAAGAPQPHGPNAGDAAAAGGSRRGTRSDSPHGGGAAGAGVGGGGALLDDEGLAALVLGSSVAACGGGGGGEDGGGGGAWRGGGAPQGAAWRGGGGGAFGAGGGDVRTQRVGEGRAAQGEAQVDFASQPQLFRVRGLLSLPPLRIPLGVELPYARFAALSAAAAARPSTASTAGAPHA
ncbi:MAG: kinase-like domain-containing protein [Monoraphidium minutum]|nr:MAG: kinase-like domain-containing protein [Monoraphidium minutum]